VHRLITGKNNSPKELNDDLKNKFISNIDSAAAQIKRSGEKNIIMHNTKGININNKISKNNE
jgi:hypothetical protein